jgi:hypothetical protein
VYIYLRDLREEVSTLGRQRIVADGVTDPARRFAIERVIADAIPENFAPPCEFHARDDESQKSSLIIEFVTPTGGFSIHINGDRCDVVAELPKRLAWVFAYQPS